MAAGWPHLEVEGQQLGTVHRLTDVQVGFVEAQGGVAEQPVGRDQCRGGILLPKQTTVKFGEEEMDLIRRLLFDGVELEHLQTQRGVSNQLSSQLHS